MCNHSQSADALTVTWVCQGGDNKSVRCQLAVEWGQAGNCMQSVCDDALINCDKLVKIANLLPSVINLLLSTCTEIYI